MLPRSIIRTDTWVNIYAVLSPPLVGKKTKPKITHDQQRTQKKNFRNLKTVAAAAAFVFVYEYITDLATRTGFVIVFGIRFECKYP